MQSAARAGTVVPRGAPATAVKATCREATGGRGTGNHGKGDRVTGGRGTGGQHLTAGGARAAASPATRYVQPFLFLDLEAPT